MHSPGTKDSLHHGTPTRPRLEIAATIRYWRTWLGGARVPDHLYRMPIERSALTIKGLTFMPTGAAVAALTTSLPETPGGERNWDYRYTWMRDATFILQALHWLKLDWEADEFMQFVADVEPTEDGSLQIMYGIDGRRQLPESTRDDLSGYSGARPVRVGTTWCLAEVFSDVTHSARRWKQGSIVGIGSSIALWVITLRRIHQQYKWRANFCDCCVCD